MTQTQALTEIFSQKNTKHTKSSTFRTWRMRFLNGRLSSEKQGVVLKKFGYKLEKEAVWSKIK